MSTPILKSLTADPKATIDFAEHKHDLTGGALKIWKEFASSHPYWWTVNDLHAVERYCDLLEFGRKLRKEADKAKGDLAALKTVWSMIKSNAIEAKAVEYSLGLTPQSRAALKLRDPGNQSNPTKSETGGDVLDPADL